jgi:hypothetical protein
MRTSCALTSTIKGGAMNKKNILPILIITISILAMVISIHLALRSETRLLASVVGADWRWYFQPAAQEVLHGRTPYAVDGFYNPPWALIPLLPLAALPLDWSIPIMMTLNLAAWTYTAMRLGMKSFLILPFIFFSGSMMNSIMANIDGLLSLGLFLPPPLAILVVMIKPQIGFPIVLFWSMRILLDQGTLKLKFINMTKLLAPFALLMVLSFVLYGTWFIQGTDAVGKSWNSSPWPRLIPLGVSLLVLSLHTKDLRWALAAIPYVTPYLSPDTWAFSTLAILAIISGIKINIPRLVPHPILKNR